MTRKKREMKQFHKRLVSAILVSSLTLSNFSGVIYAEDLLENLDLELDITQEELQEELREELQEELQDGLFEEMENEFLEDEAEEDAVEDLTGEGAEAETEVEADSDSDAVEDLEDLPQLEESFALVEPSTTDEDFSEVMILEEGIVTMAMFATIAEGGFNLEAGRYAVPVAIKNISDTDTKEIANDAIANAVAGNDAVNVGSATEVAILTVDENNEATLSLSLETFSRRGFGTSYADILETKEAYISDVKYFAPTGADNTYEITEATVNSETDGQPTKVTIGAVDSTVDGMYISFVQKTTEESLALDLVYAYLEMDYSNPVAVPDPVYTFGSGEFTPGKYDIQVTFRNNANDSNAGVNVTLGDYTDDDSTNALLVIDDDGKASLTMKFIYKLSSSKYTGLMTLAYFDDGTKDSTAVWVTPTTTIAGGNSKTYVDEITIPIVANLEVNGEDGVYVKYTSFNDAYNYTGGSSGDAFLRINYYKYAPEVEVEDDEVLLGARNTVFKKDTNYDIKVAFKKAEDITSTSMAGSTLTENAVLMIDANGVPRIQLEFTQMSMLGITGYAYNFRTILQEVYVENDINSSVLKEAVLLEGGDGTNSGYAKVVFDIPYNHMDGMFIRMDISAMSMTDTDGYIEISYPGATENSEFVVPDLGVDLNPPVLNFDDPEFSNGEKIELLVNDEVDSFVLPSVTATDNVDGDVTSTIVVTYSDSEATQTFATLDDVKVYLNATVGNTVTITYTATDFSDNTSKVTLVLVSTAVDTNEYEDVTQNGVYGVPVELLQQSNDNVSVGDGAFDGYRTAKVTTADGVYTVEVNVGTITFSGLTSGIENITSTDGMMTNIVEETSTLSDGTEYTSKFTFTTTSLEDTYLMGFGITGMDMAQTARLALDWDKATVYDENANSGGGDSTTPDEDGLAISITGYNDGDTISVSMAAIDVLTLPVATATDSVDGTLSVTTVISNDTTEFIDFDFAKVYLKAATGNTVKVVYTATNSAGDEVTATITFVSAENTSTDGLLKDNTSYGVPVQLLKAYDDEVSMGDGAFDGHRTAKVTNRGGVYTVEVNVGTVTFGGTLTSGLINVKSTDGTIFNVIEEYSTLPDGIEYTSKFTFTTTELSDTYAITFDIAEMDMTQSARLNFDWNNAEELDNAEVLYFTFGTANTMFYTGTHGMSVNVSNPADPTKTSLLTNAISAASTMTVDGNGGGKVTLRFADVIFDGTSYTPQDFMYYTSSDMSPASLLDADVVSATEATFVISDPSIDGIYISVALGDSFVSVAAYVELEYTRSETGEAYDATKVTERVEIAPPTDEDDKDDKEEDDDDDNVTTFPDEVVDIKVNGTYNVPVSLYHETQTGILSMGDAAFANSRTTSVTNDNGDYTFVVEIGTLTYAGLTGGIANVTSDDDIYDIKQEYSTDVNGERYVSKLFFTTEDIKDYYMITFDIPVMGGTTFSAKLSFDWANITKSNETIIYVYVEVEAPVEEEEEETTTVTTVAGTLADVTENGQYLVPLVLMHEVNDQVSMGDPAFDNNRYAYVSTKDGVYTVTVNPGTITMGTLTSGIGLLVSEDGRMKDLKVLEYTKLSSGDSYISSFQFTTTQLDSQYAITMTIPNAPMGATGARLVLDWSQAQTTSKAFESGAVLSAETVLTELIENGETLVVANESGLQVEFDEEALKSILEQVGDADISIVIDELSLEVQYDEDGNEIPLALTEEQKEAIGDRQAFSLQVLAGDEVIPHFGEGKVTVSIPYFLERVKSEDGLSIWHIDDDGAIKVFECGYEDYDRLVQFETSHFSIYTVEHDGSEVSAKAVIESLPFIDVTTADWFYDSVKFVYENEILAGATSTSFDPNTQMTKAMLITALYRMEGMPSVSGRNEFSDVLPDQYYSDAILWATENGIAFGNGDGTFGVNVNVTREEMVSIIYNFGVATGMDMSVSADMTAFHDHSEVDGYAVDPFTWALGAGIVSGNGSQMLAPKNTARRSEVSTILMNLVSSK